MPRSGRAGTIGIDFIGNAKTEHFSSVRSVRGGPADQCAETGIEQPPPEVDAALRDRITKFYQAHVDGKFRLADQYVAEDSKDTFFAMEKTHYLSYEIVRINYSDDFKKADAVVACRSDIYFQGHKVDMKMPSVSHWKIVDGQWFWYIPPIKEAKTPFGVMHFGTDGGSSAARPLPRRPPTPGRSQPPF